MYKLVFLLLFSVIIVTTVSTEIHTIGFEINIVERETKEVICYHDPVVFLEKGDYVQFDIRMRQEFKILHRVFCLKDSVVIYKEEVNRIAEDTTMQIWTTDSIVFDDNMAGTWDCRFVLSTPDDWNGYYTKMGRENVTEAKNCMVEFKMNGPKKILLDIYAKDKEVNCLINPAGPKYVMPGQIMQFVIRTTNEIVSLRCNNEYYQKLYRPRFIKNDNGKQVWATEDSLIEPNMVGTSTCYFEMRNPGDITQTKIEGSCAIELKMNASLWFTGLNPSRLVEYRNAFYTDYVYKYKDGEVVNVGCECKAKMAGTTKTFDFHDLSNNVAEMKNISTTLEIKLTRAHSNSYFKLAVTRGFTRAGGDKVSSLDNKRSAKAIISRKKLPIAPTIVLSITHLKQWKWKNIHKCDKMYNYTFTDGEATFACRLDNPTDNEETYRFTFYLDDKNEAHSKDVAVTKQQSMYFNHTFKLNEGNKLIVCVAMPVKGTTTAPLLKNEIYLQYVPPPVLSINGSQILGKGQYFLNNKTTIYSYYFKDGDQVTLECAANNYNYIISFYIPVEKNGVELIQSTGSTPLAYKNTFTLKKEDKVIKCVAENYGLDSNLPKYLISIVYLYYIPTEPSETGALGPVKVKITGFPEQFNKQGECIPDKDNVITTCHYNFTDNELGKELKLTCEFRGGLKKKHYNINFGKQKVSYKFKGGKVSTTDSEIINLKKDNTNINCTAKNNDLYSTTYTYDVHFNYIASKTPSTASPDGLQIISTEPPSTIDQNYLNNGGKIGFSWIWVAMACAAVFTVFFAICCTVILCRQKKPPPDESNYVNLARDQNNYQTMPIPAPRTLKPGMSRKPNVGQHPNVGQKPIVGQKPKAVLEDIYNEPKDSQDMSEAVYAEPNRCIGESDTYAEPYTKSDNYARPYDKSDNYAQPYGKSDNYAQPYAASSGDYAGLYVAPELYATPLPKAQRPPKIKDDEYSNVFTGQYGNTKK